jgi:hypothetical protein
MRGSGRACGDHRAGFCTAFRGDVRSTFVRNKGILSPPRERWPELWRGLSTSPNAHCGTAQPRPEPRNSLPSWERWPERREGQRGGRSSSTSLSRRQLLCLTRSVRHRHMRELPDIASRAQYLRSPCFLWSSLSLARLPLSRARGSARNSRPSPQRCSCREVWKVVRYGGSFQPASDTVDIPVNARRRDRSCVYGNE